MSFLQHITNYTFLIGFYSILNDNNLKLLIPNERELRNKEYNYFSDIFINWYCNEFTIRSLDIPDFYNYRVEKFLNSNERFLAFPLVLHHTDNCYNTQRELNYSHMNIIIYDKKKKSIERFDPINSRDYDSSILDLVIFNVFKNNKILKKLKILHYYTPIKICKKFTIQIKQENEINYYEKKLGENIGFCNYWSLWYLNTRLKYPEIPPENYYMVFNTTQELNTNSRKILTNFIINYLKNIINIKENIDNQINNKYRKEITNKFENISENKRKEIINETFLKLNHYFAKKLSVQMGGNPDDYTLPNVKSPYSDESSLDNTLSLKSPYSNESNIKKKSDSIDKIKKCLKDKKYEIIKYISSGANADTYLIKKEGNENELIGKVYKGSGMEFIKIFDNEVKHLKIAGKLNISPHYIDSFICENNQNEILFFIIMEYIKGSSFYEYLKKNYFQLKEIINKLNEKIELLNKFKILHRDLHANNIMIDNKNEPYIIDFGSSLDLDTLNENTRKRIYYDTDNLNYISNEFEIFINSLKSLNKLFN